MRRRVYPFNQEWLFCPAHAPNHIARRCNEGGFEQITLPHTVCRVPYSGFDESVYQQVSTYRKHFVLPADCEGQRVYVDFDGVMLASTVYLNGERIGEYRGGFTPFSFDLTEHVNWNAENVLVVVVDSNERSDIPPFGNVVDYLCYGGIYRDVHLRIVDDLFVDSAFVKPRGIVEGRPRLEIDVHLRNHLTRQAGADICLQVRDAECEVRHERALRIERVGPGESTHRATIDDVGDLDLWTLEDPQLHHLTVIVSADGRKMDAYATRFGLRECAFMPEGFLLNGQRVSLRGLNRHQGFPWVGFAMPARVQRRDAEILKHELKLNIVRTSHYPQSPHFLNRCDEVGLLVFEEIPGWQHIGDEAWQDLSCRYVREMITRDFNHPSIVIWGVRVNESPDSDAFYARTNAIARELDDTRQTGGVRCWGHTDSTRHEDVFAHNDFDPEKLRNPVHLPYLITEFCGHMYPTKHIDNVERITEHTRRHAHVLSQAASHEGIAGAIGWCAFDYSTHGDFGSGDRICHHGVADMFRLPKPVAGLYRAQCNPTEEIVLEPAFTWSIGDRPTGGGVGDALINSNCDRLRLYLGDELVTELKPLRKQFPGLVHPPFRLDGNFDYVWGHEWKALRIDGYLGEEKVITRTLSERGVDADFRVHADSDELSGDGADCTRVWFMVTDEHGNPRNFAVGSILFDLNGPGELIGDNPFALIGGRGALWVRARQSEGTIRVRAKHPTLGVRTVRIEVGRAAREALTPPKSAQEKGLVEA